MSNIKKNSTRQAVLFYKNNTCQDGVTIYFHVTAWSVLFHLYKSNLPTTTMLWNEHKTIQYLFCLHYSDGKQLLTHQPVLFLVLKLKWQIQLIFFFFFFFKNRETTKHTLADTCDSFHKMLRKQLTKSFTTQTIMFFVKTVAFFVY